MKLSLLSLWRRGSILLTLLGSISAQAASPDLVISQVYGGGGNTGAPWHNDFIELFNRGGVAVSLNGRSVQYASTAGTTWQATSLPNVMLQPGQYFLIQEASNAAVGASLPTPDATGTINMSGTNGKVALVDVTSLLTGSCPTLNVTDFVGYGTANCFEGAATAALSNTTAALRNGNGCTDTDTNSTDFSVLAPSPRNTASGLSPCGGVNLTIDNVAVVEGNSGTVTASFTVSLSAPAPVGGVTFDIASADGTATLADNDYIQNSLTGQTIAEGNTSYIFDVTVNGDTNVEPNETYFVNVTNVVGTGVTVADGQGLGTITTDDFTYTLIHDIQGPGLTSPLPVGTVVTTRGIVTGIRSNGFFIQAADADIDLDPNSSEGVFVFTNSAPPAAAARGNEVRVVGTLSEFIPAADPVSPPMTELSGAITVDFLSSGNPLPTPITLTPADTSPAGGMEQLERFEGMRVTVPSLTVIAPTGGTVNEPNATSTNNGLFYGVITGVARPFREAGIAQSDPLPPSPPCCIPRFDENPERLRVDSDGQTGGTALEVTAGALVTNITSPLDFAFRTYNLLPDPATPPSVSGNVSAGAVPVPAAGEATVASWNLERFFDTVNDGQSGEPTLTATAFANRLNKASLAIRNILRSPDVLGVAEVENLSTLQALATKINADTVAGSDPAYQAYLQEGTDVGGIDVGFLVKSSRVTVTSVTQYGLTATYINPTTGLPEALWDRPPLVLVAVMNPVGGASFPVTVIVNHLRSLSGVDDPADGARVRAKRRAEAEYLADLIQARQLANPGERMLAVGDFNAFQVNDGYVDLMGTIKGTPTSPDNVVLASSDLVNPDLVSLTEGPSAQQYSFSFDGNAQQLDHILMTANAASQLTGFHFARLGSDFPGTYRNDPLRPERLSDHDAPVAYLVGLVADLSIAVTDAPDPGTGGVPITYTVTAANLGPDPAATVNVTLTLPAGLSYGGGSGSGWSCGESAGTVTCSRPSLAVGTAPDITILANTPFTGGSFLTGTSVSSATADAVPGNNSATATTQVASNLADLGIEIADAPDPGSGGAPITYTVTVSNFGPDTATPVIVTVPLAAGLGYGGASGIGWICNESGGTVTCTRPSLVAFVSALRITIVATTPITGGSFLTTASVVSATGDLVPGNNSATATTQVASDVIFKDGFDSAPFGAPKLR